MIYKFSRFEKDGLKRYEFSSYEEAKYWVNQEIEKFKKVNRVENEYEDKSFLSFRDKLENILNADGQQGASDG